ncbi:hypothetical protein THAOC_28759 [Thalassiosira oceanica]|uniref:Uncharacterized protein n=1 Tax=Thalassiosira oceanica TaxID=159749 RepID=K0RIA3_THAOC|nr:hypothetical protein THAOC_28759 [Thalassiosira oceanica]|eukprot:EJK52014.1 hypothetical protein THAOC_28759 [Thalassiosira oceanica]
MLISRCFMAFPVYVEEGKIRKLWRCVDSPSPTDFGRLTTNDMVSVFLSASAPSKFFGSLANSFAFNLYAPAPVDCASASSVAAKRSKRGRLSHGVKEKPDTWPCTDRQRTATMNLRRSI